MIGETILHYKILEKLGEGGMGVVYKAEDTKLERIVAIKFLPHHIAANAEERERFKIEAKTAAALNHPNIATIYAIEEVNGEMFIVMEFIEGQELRKLLIDNGQLSIDNCLAYATQIAEGLKAAHAKGITHRDIKCSNIMVTESGQVKIMDFGLAKIGGDVHLTKAGMTLGTAAYMSPEQVRGEEVDHRTDIWAFGVVLYEMLTGQLPFRGEYEAAMMYSILNVAPEPIIPTGSGRTGVPMELERIVNKCLEKQAAHRYQHAGDLLADLRRLQLEPKSALRPSQQTAAAASSRKRLLARVLPLALLLVAIISGVGYLFFSREAESQERIPIVVVDFVNETEEKELNGLSGMLITALEQSRRLSVLTRSQMFDILKKSGKTEVDRIDETLGREICRHAEVKAMAMASIRKFGQVYLVDLKLLDTEKDRYLVTAKEKGSGQESIPDIIDRLAEQTRSGLKEQAAEIQTTSRKIAEVTTVNLEAYQHYFLGEQLINKLKFAEAQEEFKQAIALDSTFGLAYYRWAYAESWLSQSEQLQKPQLEKALALIDRIPEKERYLVRTHSAYLEKGYEAAIAILKEMEQIYPNDKEMLYNIGDYALHADQYTTAVEYLEKVLAMEPTHARALQHLVSAYQVLGKYKKLVEVAERYLSITGSQEAYLWLGEAYGRIGDFPAAWNTVQKAQKLFAEDFGMSNTIGAIYFAQGDYDQAEAAFKRSLSQNNNALANMVGYMGLADVYVVTGQYQKSLQVGDQMIETCYMANLTSWGAFNQLHCCPVKTPSLVDDTLI